MDHSHEWTFDVELVLGERLKERVGCELVESRRGLGRTKGWDLDLQRLS